MVADHNVRLVLILAGWQVLRQTIGRQAATVVNVDQIAASLLHTEPWPVVLRRLEICQDKTPYTGVED